jgi:hypothetical protein
VRERAPATDPQLDLSGNHGFFGVAASFVITASGSHFVAASDVVFNGAPLVTTVVSTAELTATIAASMIPAPGSFNLVVHTPGGNTGDLGCSSGGTSRGEVLTVN